MRSNWGFSVAFLVFCSGCAETPLEVNNTRGLTTLAGSSDQSTTRSLAVAEAPTRHHEATVVPAAIFAKHQEMTSDYARLVSKQLTLVMKLEASVRELQDTCNQLSADFERIDPRQEWHERMIVNNRKSYEAVCAMLLSLTEEEFPTQQAWYGDAWTKLTSPYRVGQFPQPDERDELVRLLHEIMASEKKRAATLARNITSSKATVVPIGYCLGPRWEQLYQDLCQLKY